jgi:hypothetical protein
MIRPPSTAHADRPALDFLRQYPRISQQLCAELGNNLLQVVALLEPVLEAELRYGVQRHFVYGVAQGRVAFLVTNLPSGQTMRASDIASHWFVGRSGTSTIVLSHATISRNHALLGFCPARGFYVLDVGSKNGTYLNDQILETSVQHWVQHGDHLQLGKVKVDFLISGWQPQSQSLPVELTSPSVLPLQNLLDSEVLDTQDIQTFPG